jgi:hypothetical protein
MAYLNGLLNEKLPRYLTSVFIIEQYSGSPWSLDSHPQA